MHVLSTLRENIAVSNVLLKHLLKHSLILYFSAVEFYEAKFT